MKLARRAEKRGRELPMFRSPALRARAESSESFDLDSRALEFRPHFDSCLRVTRRASDGSSRTTCPYALDLP